MRLCIHTWLTPSSHAHFSLGNYSDAIEAYESGLQLDPSNANMKTALSHAKTRLAETSKSDDAISAPEGSRGPAGAGAGGMPDLSALAGLMGGMGGMGGGGGAGGMPDLAAMMRNPALMNMCVWKKQTSNGHTDVSSGLSR